MSSEGVQAMFSGGVQPRKHIRNSSGAESYTSPNRRSEDGRFIFAILFALAVLVIFWLLYVAAYGPHLFLL